MVRRSERSKTCKELVVSVDDSVKTLFSHIVSGGFGEVVGKLSLCIAGVLRFLMSKSFRSLVDRRSNCVSLTLWTEIGLELVAMVSVLVNVFESHRMTRSLSSMDVMFLDWLM